MRKYKKDDKIIMVTNKMTNIYEKLEFNKILDQLKFYAHLELTLKYISNLKMLEEDNLSYALKELNEAIAFANKYKGISCFNIKNIMPSLLNLVKDGTASIDFFVTISLMQENIIAIKKDYPNDENYPLLNNYVSNLKALESLKNRIDSVIASDASIYDNASSKLFSLRNQIKHEESNQPKIISSLMNKYRSFLNDERIVLKNKGLALPIKTTFKNKLDGIVVDVSASGNTTFIMPIEILLSNNKIELLKEQEQEEILHILKDLAHIAANNVEDLKNNLLTLTHLDFLFAKVSYAFDLHAIVGRKSDTFSLILARHPLIDYTKVIANSFVLDKERIMLITGPNAGGKTIALKTIGIIILMHQCGLAIPCIDGSIPFFENIYLDIGDDQSLENNLSTFTSHMRALKNAILNVNDKSLVLIDELGSGTSPLDGEALAIGVIKHLHAKNAYALVSSHYDGLKSFALEQDYILNASMIFDEINLKPTYKIRLGVAGKSYGIEVAEREGIPSSIINEAKTYIQEKKNSQKEETLESLNAKLLEVDNLKAELTLKNQELMETLNKQNQELEKIKKEKQDLMDNLQEEKAKLLLEAREEVETMMDEFKNKKDKKMHEVISLKKKIDDQIADLDPKEENSLPDDFKINDRVSYENNKGFIKSITKNKAQVVLDSGLTVTLKLGMLKHVASNNKVKRPVSNDVFVTSKLSSYNIPLQCNVVGMHIDEALETVARYLDQAVAVKYHRVRIIHGNGTGKLRSAIHEFLKKQKYVESYSLAFTSEGGTGATVVNLK